LLSYWLSCFKNVETHHTADQVHADLLLPSLLRSAEYDLNTSGLISLQLESVLRVHGPRLVLLLLLKLLVIQMATASGFFSPLT